MIACGGLKTEHDIGDTSRSHRQQGSWSTKTMKTSANNVYTAIGIARN
ncbi:hypothetical protein OH492_13635 [Vibrio chagasii]|nr:hypothetical protein [Vibrio chagasii]